MTANESAAPQRAKVNIISGFLGAGKTTFINKLLDEGFGGPDCALVENEFGDVAIDDELIQGDNMDVRTLAQGCICCTLKVDFVQCLVDIVETFGPKRIIIEPTGIASAAQIVQMCEMPILRNKVEVESVVTIVDPDECEELIEFEVPVFLSQLNEANLVLLSRMQMIGPEARERVLKVLDDFYGKRRVVIVSDNWDDISALEMVELAAEAYTTLGYGAPEDRPQPEEPEEPEEERQRECGHHHKPGEECECGHHHHEHEHEHHHSREVDGIASFAFQPTASFDEARLAQLQGALGEGARGMVLRAKGFLPTPDGMLLYEQVRRFVSITPSTYGKTPKFVLIGQDLHPEDFESLLGPCQR